MNTADRQTREAIVLRITRWACGLTAASWLVSAWGHAPDLVRLGAWTFLLLGVPTALAALTWFARGRVLSTRRRRWTVRAAVAALVIAWLPVGAFATLWVAVTEPWPLSLRQGPDTASARETFERNLGFAPPPSVTQLFARLEWGGPGEHLLYVSFHFEDDAVLEQIVTHLRLERDDEAPAAPDFSGPAWWPPMDSLDQIAEIYRWPNGQPQRFVRLWVDRSASRAYLHDVDVS